MYTVIRFVSISAKFGICTGLGSKWDTFFELKNAHMQVSKVRILASTSVYFGPTTVQMPNLALLETKWIAVS